MTRSLSPHFPHRALFTAGALLFAASCNGPADTGVDPGGEPAHPTSACSFAHDAAHEGSIAVFTGDLEAFLRDAQVPIWGREEGIVITGPSYPQLESLCAQGVTPLYSAEDSGEAIHVLSHDSLFTPPDFPGVARFDINEQAVMYLLPANSDMRLPRLKLHALFHGVPRIEIPPIVPPEEDMAKLSGVSPELFITPISLVQQIVDSTSQASWYQFVRDLSGDSDVTIPGFCTNCRIRTRASNYMFPLNNTGTPLGNPYATEYLEYKAAGWGFTGANATRESYTSANSGCTTAQGAQTWQNVVFTLPAQVDYAQSQQVIFLVHYDTISESAANDANNAPGADDAMSGGTALLEAMRLFKDYAWAHPVKFLFVTGEEVGLCGSTAYTRMHPVAPMWRVLNMDQTAFDGNKNGLMNLYNWSTASCPSCVAFGDAFVQANADYGNIINPAKIVRNTTKMCQTDHCPFWNVGATAIDLNEDLTNNDICPCFDQFQTSTCRDTVTQMYPVGSQTPMFDQAYSWPTEKAAIALIAHTAQPLYACPAAGVASITPAASAHQVQLSWTDVPPVSSYVVERAPGGCGGTFTGIGTSAGGSYTDTTVTAGATYGYRIRTCPFQVSSCVSVTANGPSVIYQPGSAVITADTGGDADLKADNCETVTANVTLINDGNVPLTGVTLNAVGTTSSAVQILSGAPQTLGDLAVGATVPATFQFNVGRTGTSAACGESLGFTLTASSNEALPSNGAFAFTAEQSQTPGPLNYGFETDFSGWTVNAGVFTRVSGGATGSTAFSLHSRTPVINNDCNSVISPVILPTASSAMTMYVNYNIQAGNFDRAQVRAVNVATGAKTVLVPTVTPYDTTATGTGLCDNVGAANGWSGNHATWRQASFNLASFASTPIQIEVRYSTDASSVKTQGFWLDKVSITNATQVACDTQTNTCAP